MSTVGSSVVNKSGKKVAPKAPPRRRFTNTPSATTSASPRLSLEPGRQRESHDTTVGELSSVVTKDIPRSIEPVSKRRKIIDPNSLNIGFTTFTESTTSESSNRNEPTQEVSEIPQVLTPNHQASHSAQPSTRNRSNRLSISSTSEVVSGVDDPTSTLEVHLISASGSTIEAFADNHTSGSLEVVAYEAPNQTASQITWNLRTGKTTDETVGPGRGKRKSTRRSTRVTDKNDEGEDGTNDNQAVMTGAVQSPSTHSEIESSTTSKSLRKRKSQPKINDMQINTSTEDIRTSPVDQGSSSHAKAQTSSRLRNQEKRKEKAAARLQESTTIETESEIIILEQVQQQDEVDQTTSDFTEKRQHRARASTPEGSEAVQIVPSVVTMFELSARNIRTGWKSEREKLMAQIDWDGVKRRRKAEEMALAQQPHIITEVIGGTSNENGNDENEGQVDGDLDAQLTRAVAKNKKKQQTLKIRLVNGEHIIDEASQFVDRHALANEEEELVEEVEEDDLTKKFNTQSLIRLRRKDPAERVRNWDPWTIQLTDRFYDCLRKFGTDFMIIAKCFPGRTRREIKAKFVREERDDPDRVHNALVGISNETESWNLEDFQVLANLSTDNITDPKQLYAELKRRREEREKEIEEQKKETAELERQKKLAGISNSDEEDGGAVISEAETPPKTKKKSSKEKKKRERKKRKGHPKDGGDEEEILEDMEE